MGQDVSSLNWVPIALASVYMFMFSIGFGPVAWVYLGEIFPDNIKGVASSVVAATSWMGSFVITKFYPGLAASVGNASCYWFFFVCSAVACLFIGFLLPETKGRTLDEIQADLSGSGKSKRRKSLALESQDVKDCHKVAR